jgi:hypothetical protein
MLQSFAFRSPLLGRLSRRPAWNRQARDLTGLSPTGLRLQLGRTLTFRKQTVNAAFDPLQTVEPLPKQTLSVKKADAAGA